MRMIYNKKKIDVLIFISFVRATLIDYDNGCNCGRSGSIVIVLVVLLLPVGGKFLVV